MIFAYIASQNHVTIDIDLDVSQILIKGDKNGVHEVKAAIEKILHEIEREKITAEASEREAKLVQKQVRWQYLSDDDEFEDYSAQLNYKIEEAYQSHLKSKQNPIFGFEENGVQYQIIFSSNPMQEKDCRNKSLTTVQRIDSDKKGIKMLCSFSGNHSLFNSKAAAHVAVDLQCWTV